MATLKEKIKQSEFLSKLSIWLLTPPNDPRPRWWVRNFVTPFYHKFGKGSKVRSLARLDVFPYNKFTLGNNSIIEFNAIINNGVGDVYIGNDCIIGIGSTVIGPVFIGNHVMIAQHVVLSGLNHDYQDISRPIKSQGVTKLLIHIGDETWIGANSIITAGVTIGKHCIIAGGSVVTRDVPDYTVVAGNPARILKQYNFQTSSWEKYIASHKD